MSTAPSSSGGDYDLSNPGGSFVDVVRRVVARPAAFFAGIPRRGNYLAPLAFALICIEISTILGGLLRLAWRTEAVGGIRFEGPGYGFGAFIADVILAPIGGAIGLFVLAAIVHLFVMLFVGNANSGYEATFRVVAYVSVTNLVNWIPIIGGLIALYGLYLAVVGIREMHATTTGRAALVVMVPIAAILALVLILVLVAGAVILTRLS
ncbi:MAG TPA: YIP1 family protein [Rubrobacter sp.]|nr:YIP1 family protein [Rubrobacter sp.]